MFGEVQSQLGNTMKSHHSMMLDKLLKTVISDKNDQLIQNDPSYHHNNNSSFLSESTGDSLNNNEVWSEINQQKHVKDNNVHIIGDESNLAMASRSRHWLPIELQMPVPIPMHMPSIQVPIPMHMPSIQVEQQQDYHHQNQQIIGLCPNFNAAQSVYDENKPMEIDYSENSLAMSMPISSTCSNSKGDAAAAVAVGVGIGRTHENLEKSVERKQKRMAKNRESAAKSRAKKQEHINKLAMDKFQLAIINKELNMRKVHNAYLFLLY
ncbi:unnamed protein product [Lathyrus sativus]|nr:unnamed protein product [Lathyrus sativus]